MPDSDSLEQLALEAYTFLYPLVLMDVTRRQMTSARPGERAGRGPMDTFTHVRSYPAADFRDVVRPNFDTLYSIAWLDVRHEPRVLTVPDTGGRFYMLPMLDMWTDVFAVPGSRTTGTAGASYAVTPPGWRGQLDHDLEAIEAPTPYVWIIGRTQTNGPADYAAVHQVQDGFTITSLSKSSQGTDEPPPSVRYSVDREMAPLRQVGAMDGQTFFAYGAELMRLHRPHHSDWSQLMRMARLGIVAGEPLDWSALPAAAREALDSVPATAPAALAAQALRMGTMANGWLLLGNSVGVYGNWYNKRAFIAMLGLGANQPEDAVYPVLQADADGAPLDGSNDYILHFDAGELPPADAFWSVTMYDAEGFQVANELDRFALGDRDPLAYNADGSLDLYLRRTNPGPDQVTNWLPTSAGPLGVTMRIYAPQPSAVDGSWSPPPVRKA
jgi:hypothetical protein